MSSETIEWRDVEGYEGLYRVSSDGEIASCDRVVGARNGFHAVRRGRILNPRKDKDGYKIVCLHGHRERKFMRVHRVVLLAFVGQPGSGQEACHNDGNPENNRVKNLRWGTKSENQGDRISHGTMLFGEKSPKAILTKDNVNQIREMLSLGKSCASIASYFGVSRKAISDIKIGKRWALVPHEPRPVQGVGP